MKKCLDSNQQNALDIVSRPLFFFQEITQKALNKEPVRQV
jgi:hypothetical protein